MTGRPSGLFACRIAFVRRALLEAATAAECLPALAAMVELAGELYGDDLGGTGAGRARRLLDEAVKYLRAASQALPAGGQEHCAALYLTARACLRRGEPGWVTDVDDAIACLRRLLAILPAADPDRTEAEVLLADALLVRGVKVEGRGADVDEASRVLAATLAVLPRDHEGRRDVTALLAMALCVRYVGFGGTAADRDAAEAHAARVLAAPGEPDEPATTAHLVLAWTALTRKHTPQQRSSMLAQPDMQAVRFDRTAAARVLGSLGEVQIPAADAESALGHLRRIPADAGSTFTRAMVPLLRAIAQLALMQGGTEVTDAGPVAESMASLAASLEADEVERGELLALRAALLAGQSAAGSSDALGEAASALPPGHLLRSPLLNMLGPLLGGQVDQAGSADDLSARLDEVAGVLDRLPHDDPEAAHAMTVLGMHVLNASIGDRTVLQRDSLFAQLERHASGLAADDPLAPVAEFMLWSARHVRARLAHDTERADDALGEMIRRADLLPEGHDQRLFALYAVAVAHVERHGLNKDLRDLDLAARAVEGVFAAAAGGGPFGAGGPLHGHLLFLRGHLGTMRAVYDQSLPSLPKVDQAIEDLEQAVALLGPAESGRLGMITPLATARLLRAQLTERLGPDLPLGQDVNDTFDQLAEAAERAGRDSMDYPVLAAQAASGLMLRGIAQHDLTLLDRGIALLADVCALPGLGLRERPLMLELHGQALHSRYATMSGDRRDLGNAIARLEEARRAVEQEVGSPHAASVLQSLASAYRSRASEALGDVDRAVELGLAGLRERAANVLLQDSDRNALDMAREATNDAAEMARWFLAYGKHDAAVSALELGRGMVLHAATSGAGVAQALAEAGHQDLAREWTAQAVRSTARTAAGQLPGGYEEPPQDDDLRYRAIRALRGTPAAARLLSAPALADITAALASSGVDALVYLLPHDDGGLGTGVIVDRAGTISPLRLYRLRVGAGTPVGEFLRTRRAAERAAEVPDAMTLAASRAAEAALEAAVADWAQALDAVCDWAWPAAIGPVLAALAKRSGPHLLPGSADPPRIVLVPGGELGVIPWHAARRPAGGEPARYDYACRHAVFSYASSARQFIDAARRRVRPWPQQPVLISDSDPNYTYSTLEIAHLHAAHYPGGAVFGAARHDLQDPGRPGKDMASPRDLLDALPHGPHPGASMLHFDSHGRVSVPVLGSSLRLGANLRGVEVRVSVSDILRQARTGPVQAAGGLVVLASCLTDVTETDYDEALTLATAFLAVGSAGVVAARWMVTDPQSALFMAAFHRFLNRGRRDPAHALREAQLWMLDPDREVPDDWPELVRDEARRDITDLTTVAAWAGFTYQGR